MAISLVATGAWARVVTDLGTVTIPGTPAAGDRMFLFGSWKDWAITVSVSGWTEITSFADGTVNAGNGTGSVKVACWYRDWQVGDLVATLDYSSAPTEGHWVIQNWTKGASEHWSTPTFVTAAVAANDPWSATSSSTITILDGSVVFSLVGLRDDSTTIARGADDIDDDGTPTVTWNGNVVESPATHFNSTTGLDMSGDLVHRLVTTGASGVNLTTAGNPAAAETGACLWVHEGLAPDVTGSGGITVAAPASASAAIEEMIGSGGVDLDAPALAASGSVETGATGTGAITFAAPTLEASGLETMTGSATLTFAAPAIAATAAETFLATGSVTFLAPTFDGTGTGGDAPPEQIAFGHAHAAHAQAAAMAALELQDEEDQFLLGGI